MKFIVYAFNTKYICKLLRIYNPTNMKFYLSIGLLFLFYVQQVSGQDSIEVRQTEPSASVDSGSLRQSPDTALMTDAQKQTFEEERFEELRAKNPFEVSHIPIRRKGPSIGQIPLDIKPKVNTNFIFWLMLFSWLLLAVVLGNKRDILPKLSRSLFNENVLKLTKRQDGEGLNLHYVLMYIVFFINASVFIYLIGKQYFDEPSVWTWFLILLSIAAIYIVRHIVMRFIGWLFPLEKESSLYSFTIMVINLLLGLFLIPVNLLMAFGPENLFKPAFIVGLVIIGILLLIRYLRGLFISANFVVSNFFLFFVYLCTLELAPLLIGYRLITNLT